MLALSEHDLDITLWSHIEVTRAACESTKAEKSVLPARE